MKKAMSIFAIGIVSVSLLTLVIGLFLPDHWEAESVQIIDPPYELKHEYATLIDALDGALKRFATGCYLVWYPLLARPESQRLPRQLLRAAAAAQSWLHVRLHVGAPAADGLGMTGSGMFVFNPPWTLRTAMEASLPWLVERLGQDSRAHFEIDGHQP